MQSDENESATSKQDNLKKLAEMREYSDSERDKDFNPANHQAIHQSIRIIQKQINQSINQTTRKRAQHERNS